MNAFFMSMSVCIPLLLAMCVAQLLNFILQDTKTFQDARMGIPVSKQRRFDVYPDVSS
jgi:hypothetical protein